MKKKTKQQGQTKSHFDKKAIDWNLQSLGKKDIMDTIYQRSKIVIDYARQLGNIKNYLDIGCGTGQLVLAVSNYALKSYGVDFASEMIKIADENKMKERINNAEFVNTSIFDFLEKSKKFELISALGFIEYISPEELELLLQKLSKCLARKGYFIFSTRNRIYNAFSMNEFTKMEMKLGVLHDLINEAIILGEKPLTSALEKLRNLTIKYPHPEKHPNTGVDVDLRYQYTPGELSRKLEEYNFSITELYSINYHALPPQMKKELYDIYRKIGEEVYSRGRNNHQLIPFSSSYVVVSKQG